MKRKIYIEFEDGDSPKDIGVLWASIFNSISFFGFKEAKVSKVLPADSEEPWTFKATELMPQEFTISLADIVE